MKNQFTFLTGLGILCFLLFAGVFRFFQNDYLYHHTLGRISSNYEWSQTGKNYEIIKVSKPFKEVNNTNLETWDAVIYKCISDRMYVIERACYGMVRAAFFPLFPGLWKALHCTSIGISVINYFIFIASLAWLFTLLVPARMPGQALDYIILATLPSSVFFLIPYTEALFMLTMTIVAAGIIKKKYLIFFAGSFLLAMVRPATVFIYLAIMCAELVLMIKNKSYINSLKEMLFKSLPFLAGYFLSVFIQYMYSGSWTSMIEAQKYWGGKIENIGTISDWSVEGFGMSVFSLFFICIPLLIYISKMLVKTLNKGQVFKLHPEEPDGYLFLVSSFYLVGIFIFTLITSGGNLRSFSRFTLASPAFFIVVLISLKYLFHAPPRLPMIIYGLCTLLSLFFIFSVEYGGSRVDYSFAGYYMFIATGLFVLINRVMPTHSKIPAAIIIVLLNTVWNTYLLNAFLSKGWTFT